jgi:hypothetical protein
MHFCHVVRMHQRMVCIAKACAERHRERADILIESANSKPRGGRPSEWKVSPALELERARASIKMWLRGGLQLKIDRWMVDLKCQKLYRGHYRLTSSHCVQRGRYRYCRQCGTLT